MTDQVRLSSDDVVGGPPAKSLRGDRTMIKSSVPLSWDVNQPLSWDTNDEVCSWNNEAAEAERLGQVPPSGPTYALQDPRDKGPPMKMIEKPIPLSWDTGDELCEWNRKQKDIGPREGTQSLDPEGDLGYKKDMIKTSIPLSWDTNKPVSWMEDQPEGQEPTTALREAGEEAPIMIKPRSLPLGWDVNHPLR